MKNTSESPQSETPSFYSVVPATVRYCKDLSPQEKLLYSEITALTNKEGYCWATNNYFANLYGLKKDSVSKQISNLVKCGFIRIEMIYVEGTSQIQERRIYLTLIPPPIGKKSDRGIGKKSDTPIGKKSYDNNTRLNITSINKQQRPAEKIDLVKLDRPSKKKDVVVVSEPAHNPEWDITSLDFIQEPLTDTQKVAVLNAYKGDSERAKVNYQTAQRQGGVRGIVGWLIAAAENEITPPIGVKAQTKNRFVNFQQRDIDFKELERLELEQLKQSMKGGEGQEEFVN